MISYKQLPVMHFLSIQHHAESQERQLSVRKGQILLSVAKSGSNRALKNPRLTPGVWLSLYCSVKIIQVCRRQLPDRNSCQLHNQSRFHHLRR
jgi:hypothetical protein